MQKIKKDDDIIIITGKDKGKVGRVIKVIPEDSKVVVEGLNLAKKHKKGNPQMQQQGGIVDKEMPIHWSNVAIYNQVTKKADRVGIKLLEDGRKVRYFKSTDEVIDV